MKTNKSKRNASKEKAPKAIIKASKTQESIKKHYKQKWSNTKSVYTRPR